jgi:uncharacterized protein (DUF2267 family)
MSSAAERYGEMVRAAYTAHPDDDDVIQPRTLLNEVMDDQGPDRQTAWHILGAVLRAVRDNLPAELAAHLGSQLPLLVRGAYYDQYQPDKQPMRMRSQGEFLGRIEEEMAFSRPVNAAEAVRSVFAVLEAHVDPGQLRKVREALPAEIRALWPDGAAFDA